MKDRYSLGLVSISFRGHAPREILSAMQGAGLTHIEWGSDVHAPCRDEGRLRELAALSREYGVTPAAYGTYFRIGQTPLSELSDYIRAAGILGTRTLRVWCGEKRGADMTGAERAALLSDCRAAARVAEEAGVVLCTECHMQTLTEDPLDTVWLMEEVASPAFRTLWQPFQWQTPEENLKNARTVAPYAAHLHVFHWRGSERLPLREAVGEWQAYLQAFTTPRTLLLEFMPGDSLSELAAEAAALRTIIGGTK